MATAQDYLSGLQYGAPGGGVGVNADKMNPEFANRLQALIQAAEQATGDKVSIFEGYRDPARSAQLRADYKGVPVKYDGKTYQPTPGMAGKYRAAAPGVSEHNTGMAVDIRAGKNPDKYPSGPAYEYMTKHAADFGLHWFGSSDPAHFEIPPSEYKSALAGTPLKPFTSASGTALAAIDTLAPRASSSVAYAYAAPVPRNRPIAPAPPPLPVARPSNIDNGGFNLAPPNLPLNAALPANRGASYGPNTGQWGPTVSQLGMQAFPPSIPASGRAVAVPQSVGIHGAASLTAPAIDGVGAGPQWGDLTGMLNSGAPKPMPGRPAALSASAAPVPMPGRPAALMAAPPTPVQAQPPQLPSQRPSAPVAPPPVQQLRLPSGKSIAPGIYDQGDHSVMVSDAGDGTARIERIRGPMSIPGVIDPLREANANTIAGGMIRKMLPGQLAGNASNFVPAVTDNVKAAAVGAAQNLGNSIGGMFGGLGSMFAPKVPTTWAPWGSIPALPQQRQQVRAPVPMSRPPSFFAQTAPQAPTVAVARSAAPAQSGGYANGKQNAINDTLRTLGFNV